VDQVAMIQRFKTRLAGTADALSEAECLIYLDEVYQHMIPDEVPGFLTEGDFTVSTVASTQEYDFPDTVHSVRRGAQIDDEMIDTYFRASEMWFHHTRTDVSEGLPYSALFYEKKIALFPVPDAVYTLWVPARMYPAAGLTSTGIANDTHAKTVVAGGAREYAADLGYDEIATREGLRFADGLSSLKCRSASVPRERLARRTF